MGHFTRHFCISAALLLATPCLRAQLEGHVNVEGEYQPVVIETERLNTYPVSPGFELPDVNLDYESAGIVTDYAPSLLSMGVTGWRTFPAHRIPKGYLELRLGSYLNSLVRAGWRAVGDSVNTLDVGIDFRSSTLYRMHGVPDSYTRPPRKRYYDGKAFVNYSRLIGDEGLLAARAFYRGAYFNYYGTTLPEENAAAGFRAPTQTLNQAALQARYSSSPSPVEGWHAGLSFDYLAYRRLYAPTGLFSTAPGADLLPSVQQGDRETRLNINGGYAFSLSDVSAFTLGASADFLFYPERSWPLVEAFSTTRKDYGIIGINPAFRIKRDNIDVEAGLVVDMTYGAMGATPDKGYNFLHVAPKVSFDYRTLFFGLHLSATGGTTPLTLALREEFDRYQLPLLPTTRPLYSPIDARLAFSVGPFSGFAAEAGVRWAIARNTPLGGWYQVMLGSWLPASNYGNLDFAQTSLNLHGISADLNLRYVFSPIAEANVSAAYTPQKGSRGIFNGYDRPRWTLEAGVSVRPVRALKIDLGYEYRGVRNCYAFTADAAGPRLTAFRLPDVTDLKARIGYMVLPNFEIYCMGTNLINRRIDILPGLQSEGITLSGGMFLEF